jgi:hypothetical protein
MLRAELYGDRGGPELARRLALPIRTWYNYESGVTVPAEVVLRIIELTSVEPLWLLHGQGPKFRVPRPGTAEAVPGSGVSVGALLRTALQMLEHEEPVRVPALARREREAQNGSHDGGPGEDAALVEVDDAGREPLARTPGPQYLAARSEWLDAERESRCIQVVGDAMAPILMDGAYVAFSRSEEPLADLDGKMVVAWIDSQPMVRWFQYCDKVAVLRAENPATVPHQILIDLSSPAESRKVRRLLWINTPH